MFRTRKQPQKSLTPGPWFEGLDVAHAKIRTIPIHNHKQNMERQATLASPATSLFRPVTPPQSDSCCPALKPGILPENEKDNGMTVLRKEAPDLHPGNDSGHWTDSSVIDTLEKHIAGADSAFTRANESSATVSIVLTPSSPHAPKAVYQPPSPPQSIFNSGSFEGQELYEPCSCAEYEDRSATIAAAAALVFMRHSPPPGTTDNPDEPRSIFEVPFKSRLGWVPGVGPLRARGEGRKSRTVSPSGIYPKADWLGRAAFWGP